jgi:O-antigen/teichoic acid export membrane protein
MLSTGGTAVLGIAFWAEAARIFRPEAVGVGSAEVSAMSLLAGFAQLNLASAFVRYLPVSGREAGRAVRFGYGLALLTAAIVGGAFLLLAPARSVVGAGWATSLIFVVSVLLWTVFALQDGVLTGLSRTTVVPIENIGFGAAKLALLPVMVVVSARAGVFFAWTAPVVAAVGLVTLYLKRRALPDAHRDLPVRTSELPRGAELRSFLSAEYVQSVITSAAAFLLPVIIESQRGSVAEAHFYIPWLIYISFLNLLTNVSSGLVVEMARKGTHATSARRALAIMAAVAVVALLVCSIVPGLVLGVFSPGYATSGAVGVLRLVGISMPFSVLATMLASYLWVERRIWSLAVVRFVQAAALIGGSELLLPKLGMTGVGVSLLAENAVVGVLGAPYLWRWYRRLADAPGHGREPTAA